jgi:predicted RNase H-like HicB family nuclease
VVPTAGTNVLLQRKEISDHFNEVLKVADGGNYLQLQQLYTDPLQLAPIAGALYEFTHSCGTAPISIVHWENGALSETYKLSKFTKEARNQLMVITPKVEEEKEERIVPGLVRITKKGSALPKLKAMEEFSDKEVTLSFAPNIICHEYNTYQLRIPLQCGLTKVDDFYVIKNDLLDIIGVGETVTEAEINFSEEFDFTYQRYNELQDIELTERIKAIRNFLNYFVISINKQNGGA